MGTAWLTRLATALFTTQMHHSLVELKSRKDYIQKKICSAGIIHQFFVMNLCRRRRRRLYRNVIKMRLALTAYARTMQPLVMAASAPVVRHFLDIHAFHKEAPNVAGALRRFRARVVLIQKWWAQLKMIRRAYI